MYGTPLELSKLCSNVIVKEFYHENELIFRSNINELNLPQDIIDSIVERYLLIKHMVAFLT